MDQVEMPPVIYFGEGKKNLKKISPFFRDGGIELLVYLKPLSSISNYLFPINSVVIIDVELNSQLENKSFLNWLENQTNISIFLLIESRDLKLGVECLRIGAEDFVLKPVDPEGLFKKILPTLEEIHFKIHLNSTRNEVLESDSFFGMTSVSSSMKKVIKEVKDFKNLDGCRMMVVGEPESGKKKLSRIVYKMISRPNEPILFLNCLSLKGRIPESEFFGHENALLNAAIDERLKDFEVVKNGLLLIDHLEEADTDTQDLLWEILLDSPELRVISNCTPKIHSQIAKKAFNHDLFLSLSQEVLRVPPLRERTEDIPILFFEFLKEFSKMHQIKVPEVDVEILNNLKKNIWHGNVTELRDEVEKIVIISKNKEEFQKPAHL